MRLTGERPQPDFVGDATLYGGRLFGSSHPGRFNVVLADGYDTGCGLRSLGTSSAGRSAGWPGTTSGTPSGSRGSGTTSGSSRTATTTASCPFAGTARARTRRRRGPRRARRRVDPNPSDARVVRAVLIGYCGEGHPFPHEMSLLHETTLGRRRSPGTRREPGPIRRRAAVHESATASGCCRK